MRDDVLWLMVLLVANSVKSDVAYDMLNREFIEGFKKEYNKLPDKPSVLDALLVYTVDELTLRSPSDRNIIHKLKDERLSIIRGFLSLDRSQVITQLASREIVYKSIQRFLKRENFDPKMYAVLDSNRPRTIFTMFLEQFRERSAHAYEYQGDFIVFVMHSFKNYFYPGHKQDIWEMLDEPDTAKRELEQNIIQEREAEDANMGDLPVHDLLMNINLANDLMFKHSGQSEDARGVRYDLYYLLLCELCREKIDNIDTQDTEYSVSFIDPFDRKEAFGDLPANKGIAAKITNAKELVPVIFDYVKHGRLNTKALIDLRETCFVLGKRDKEGRNCVWKDVVRDGETSRYLNTANAIQNFDAFDKIVKGVISVYTLMTQLELRGYDLVSYYRPELFQDKDIIRYMDYLSSTEHIDLIKELQSETPVERNRGNLLEFENMVDTYAGSKVNNHANIRENRYFAYTSGFMKNPRVKQEASFQTLFERLKSASESMDSVPRGLEELVIESTDYTSIAQYMKTSGIMVSGDMAFGKFSGLRYNSYLCKNPALAAYYLFNKNNTLTLEPLDWKVGTAPLWSAQLSSDQLRLCGHYNPMTYSFYFYGQGLESSVCYNYTEIVRTRNESIINGVPTFNAWVELVPPLTEAHMEQYAKSLHNSIGFDTLLGIDNYYSSETKQKVDKQPIYPKYKHYVLTYYKWLNGVNSLQKSMIDLLQLLLIYSIHASDKTSSYAKAEKYRAKKLLDGLMKGEFTAAILEDFLVELEGKKLVTYEIYNGKPTERLLDLSILDIILGKYKESKTDEITRDLYDSIKDVANVSERFALVFNFINIRVSFLRLLRDSMSLILNSASVDISTLVCELNTRFNVWDTLNGFVTSNIDKGVTVDTLDFSAIKSYITGQRLACTEEFSTLIKDFGAFIKESEIALATLVDYDISSKEGNGLAFGPWEDLFRLSPKYPDTLEFLELQSRLSTVDSAGFYLLNGRYFRGHYSNYYYYVHRTGHMVVSKNSTLEAATFDFDNEGDVNKYREIIRRGFIGDG